MQNEVWIKRIEEFLDELLQLNFMKKYSPKLTALGLHISATIDPIKMVTISFLISFLRSFHGKAGKWFLNFYPYSEMPVSQAAIMT